MALNSQVIQFKFCYVGAKPYNTQFSWCGVRYKLMLPYCNYERNTEILLSPSPDFSTSEGTRLLSWLSLYFGEDCFQHSTLTDARFCFNRGLFILDEENLQRYLDRVARLPYKSHALWRQRLFEKSVNYAVGAIRSGVTNMPVSMGLHAVSIEILANAYFGERTKYMTLGSSPFNRLLKEKLKSAKRGEKNRAAAKKFEKDVKADMVLLTDLRNATYGHEMLHVPDKAKKLQSELQKWCRRNGASAKTTSRVYNVSNMERTLVRDWPALYKLSLRQSRIFFFLYIGMIRSMPYATYDFSIVGDLDSPD